MKQKMILTIGWLYSDLMSTYGDRGNIICLTKRCQWRGIQVEVKNITLETSVKELEKCDLVFMGGAQDRQQKLAGFDFLKNKGPVLKKMVEKDIPALFVCAAYQAVGHYYRPYQGRDIPGASIFDLTTVHPGDQAKRLIGNVAAELLPSFWGVKRLQNNLKIDSGPIKISEDFQGKQARMTLVGFENHGGRTYLGSKMKPFARILAGYGNNGEDGYEGAVYKNAIGSYLHGPILPKNPHIADWLIKRSLEIKYQKDIKLEPLDDEMEWKAHDIMLKKLN